MKTRVPAEDEEIELGYFTEDDFAALNWQTKRIVKIEPLHKFRRHRVLVKKNEFDRTSYGRS